MSVSSLLPILLALTSGLQIDTSQNSVLNIEGSYGGLGVRDEWSVAFYPAHDRSTLNEYWMVRVKRSFSGPPGVGEQLDKWVDGRRCPTVADVAAALRSFRPPTGYDVRDAGRAAMLAPHGSRYALTTTGVLNGGEVVTTVVDQSGAALGNLAQTAIADLRPCIV